MTTFNKGDLIRATKGTTKIEAEIEWVNSNGSYGRFEFNDDSACTDTLRNYGFTVEVIKHAKTEEELKWERFNNLKPGSIMQIKQWSHESDHGLRVKRGENYWRGLTGGMHGTTYAGFDIDGLIIIHEA